MKKIYEKVIKAKRRKAEHPFVEKVFNYDLSNIAVVGAHVRLYSQSPLKIPATKHTLMSPFNYSHCYLLFR